MSLQRLIETLNKLTDTAADRICDGCSPWIMLIFRSGCFVVARLKAR